MVANNKMTFFTKLEEAFNSLEKANNIEDRVAIINYITSISSIFNNADRLKILRNIHDYDDYLKYIKSLDQEMLEKFVIDKDFHGELLWQLLYGIEGEMGGFKIEEMTPTSELSGLEYYSIFEGFVDSIGLGDFYDDFIAKSEIYTDQLKDDSARFGFTLFNPSNRNSDIFIWDFSNNIKSMWVMAHEFGHVYDLENYPMNNRDYNYYFYRSFYSEVFSKLFERLFVEFLLRNNILVNEAKDRLFEMEIINHDYIFAAYVLTLLNDKILSSGVYADLDNDVIFDLVKDNFNNTENARRFFQNSAEFDVLGHYVNTYGDIISMFLKEEIEQEGFNGELMNSLVSRRSSLFDRDFFENFGINYSNYMDLYKKEVQFIKK